MPGTLNFCPEEVSEDRLVDLALHFGEPGELEILGGDPAESLKFGVLGVDIELGVEAEVIAQEVELLLAMVPALDAPIAVKVAVRALLLDDPDVPRLHTDFLPEFADEGLLGGLAFVDATLGELPGIRHAEPFANQDAPSCVAQDGRDIVTTARLHGAGCG